MQQILLAVVLHLAYIIYTLGNGECILIDVCCMALTTAAGYRYYSEATKQAVTNTTFYLEGGAFERHFNLRLYIIGKQYQYVW